MSLFYMFYRLVNYGSCIDYVLCIFGFCLWIKGGDIFFKVYGFDYCFVYVDLYEFIIILEGVIFYFCDMFNFKDWLFSMFFVYLNDVKREVFELLRFVIKFMDEFLGR